jgi:hypothetical protein
MSTTRLSPGNWLLDEELELLAMAKTDEYTVV